MVVTDKESDIAIFEYAFHAVGALGTPVQGAFVKFVCQAGAASVADRHSRCYSAPCRLTAPTRNASVMNQLRRFDSQLAGA